MYFNENVDLIITDEVLGHDVLLVCNLKTVRTVRSKIDFRLVSKSEIYIRPVKYIYKNLQNLMLIINTEIICENT